LKISAREKISNFNDEKRLTQRVFRICFMCK